MSKYINEDELLKAIASECKYDVKSCNDCRNKCDLYSIIINQKDIIRCKDCKNYKDGKCFYTMRRHGLEDDWFCADGERNGVK